jgi:hypothetical protein
MLLCSLSFFSPVCVSQPIALFSIRYVSLRSKQLVSKNLVIQIREPAPPGWGSLRWDSKIWLQVLSDSDHWLITLQIADPSSRQRGLPAEIRAQISDSNIPTGSNIWSQVPQGCSIPRHIDWLIDWLTVSRKVTSPHLNFFYVVHTYILMPI